MANDQLFFFQAVKLFHKCKFNMFAKHPFPDTQVNIKKEKQNKTVFNEVQSRG